MVRRKIPDVMGELLGERQEKTVRQNTGKTESQNTGIPVSQKRGEEKVKATYYLSAEAIDALETTRLKLRRLVSLEQRGQINKSAIVEAALLLVAEDLETNGEKSQLANLLVNQ